MILLDTDVLLDVALGREPHAEASIALLELLERRPRMAFVAWHTVANFFYLVRPTRGAEQTRDFLVDLTGFVTVAPSSTADLRFAASLPLPDLEDAMQVASARACGAQYIATRNVKDFRKSPIPARTPAQLLEELA
ncbi:MAG: PIN domain-containing protein [Longimicrobiales bacterium]|nr:PIN domain-containing protein [Longimicrobiales bacterium]